MEETIFAPETQYFAYCRVSTDKQTVDSQILKIKEYCEKKGIILPEENIYVDMESGKTMDRVNYIQMKKMLRRGDTVLILEVDRFSRDKNGAKEELLEFNKRGIDICFIELEYLNDMKHAFGSADMWVDLIASLVLDIHFIKAQKEREDIVARTMRGLDKAKSENVKFGRPGFYVGDKEMFLTIAKLWSIDRITATHGADLAMKYAKIYYQGRLPKDERDNRQEHPNLGEIEYLTYPPTNKSISRHWFAKKASEALNEAHFVNRRDPFDVQENHILEWGLTSEDIAKQDAELRNIGRMTL